MPLYEYECDGCQERFERLQRLSDPAPGCPACGGPVQKRFSVPALQFKGSGWYVTDYSRQGSTSGGSATGEAEKGSSSKTPKKTEAAGGTTSV